MLISVSPASSGTPAPNGSSSPLQRLPGLPGLLQERLRLLRDFIEDRRCVRLALDGHLVVYLGGIVGAFWQRRGPHLRLRRRLEHLQVLLPDGISSGPVDFPGDLQRERRGPRGPPA